MDFNKITKKQLLLAALIVPILLAIIWTIRCQITSSKEYTIERPIVSCTVNSDEYGYALSVDFDNGDFSEEEYHRHRKYLTYKKDSNGYYYPDRTRIIPPLNMPFTVNRYEGEFFYVGKGEALWVQYFLNKAIKDGHTVCGIKQLKNGNDEFLNIEIDGKTCSDDIADLALSDYAEALDSVEKSIGKGVSSYCSKAICDPDNDLNYVSLLTERMDDHLPSSILYLICKKKDDSEFRETLIEKGKIWYKKYLHADKYGNLQNAIQQLTSSYHWVNQENYKELYKIYYEEDDHHGTENKEGESIAEKDKDDLEGEVEIVEKVLLDRLDRIGEKALDIDKISEFVNFQGTPDSVTIYLIGFWVRRWNDGSAETIYSVLKNLNLE
ncbi:MAG: hypothetical protein K6F48_02295 [Paludibacteraceae bacterium]|nr:hypothetical protein [Paludibacteraceae bacterium]